MTYPKLDVTPYDFVEGVTGMARWYEEVGLGLNKIHSSAYKHVLSKAVHEKVEYSVRMRPLEEYRDDETLTSLNDSQIEQIVLEDIKRQSREAAQIEDARRAATMTIHDLMGKIAKQKLLEDEEYHCNLIAPDPKPSIAMLAIERVLISQRSGSHPANKMAELNKVKKEILSPLQKKGESEWDYFQRETRLVEMAEKMGIKVIPELFKDEEERSLAFLFGLDSVRFKAWHTEIKNRVSEAPKTRKGVLEAARERNDKEDLGTDRKPDTTFITTTTSRREK